MADTRIRDTLMVEVSLQAISDVDVKLHVRLSKTENCDNELKSAETVESAIRQSRRSGMHKTSAHELAHDNS
jgi:hypothetical protein